MNNEIKTQLSNGMNNGSKTQLNNILSTISTYLKSMNHSQGHITTAKD